MSPHGPISKATIRRLRRLARAAAQWGSLDSSFDFLGYGADTKAYLHALVAAAPALIDVADATYAFMSTTEGRTLLLAYAKMRGAVGNPPRGESPRRVAMSRKAKKRSKRRG